MAKFKVRDKVKIKEGEWNGENVEVVYIRPNDKFIGVKFNNYNGTRHDVGGHCEIGFGWWYYPEDLQLLNQEKFDEHFEICKQLNETYKSKNTAYGNSFGKSFEEFGIVAALVRLEDKWNRIKALSKGAENNVLDESIKDTLLDMANYCIMTYMEVNDDEI
jgi:hypothetical protein